MKGILTNMQKALITGGSSGIGFEIAKVMAENGHDIVLAARDITQLNTAKEHILSQHKVEVKVVQSDLSQPGAAKKLYEAVKNDNIEILVNNAGVGLKGTFFGDDLGRTQQMMQLNMTSLMDLSYYFGNDFLKKNRGRILNVASIASFFPGPKQPVYFATKAFVRSFSRALAYNLRNSEVTVTALHPGVTKTNFFVAANAKDFKGGVSARSVALLGYRAMMAGKIEVTHGIWNKFLTNIFVRITPYKLQTKIVDKASEV